MIYFSSAESFLDNLVIEKTGGSSVLFDKRHSLERSQSLNNFLEMCFKRKFLNLEIVFAVDNLIISHGKALSTIVRPTLS